MKKLKLIISGIILPTVVLFGQANAQDKNLDVLIEQAQTAQFVPRYDDGKDRPICIELVGEELEKARNALFERGHSSSDACMVYSCQETFSYEGGKFANYPCFIDGDDGKKIFIPRACEVDEEGCS